MPEILLIDRAKIIEVCNNVSSNLQEDKLINPQILQVQRTELAPFLGNAFYFDLVNNIADQKYIDLLDGKSFVNCEGNTAFFYGIKYILAWRLYVVMLNSANLHLTRAGSRRMQGQVETESYNQKQLNQVINNANSKAIFYENNTIDYLNENKETYPFWEDCHSVSSNTSISFHISRKNKTNKRYINDYKDFYRKW